MLIAFLDLRIHLTRLALHLGKPDMLLPSPQMAREKPLLKLALNAS